MEPRLLYGRTGTYIGNKPATFEVGVKKTHKLKPGDPVEILSQGVSNEPIVLGKGRVGLIVREVPMEVTSAIRQVITVVPEVEDGEPK